MARIYNGRFHMPEEPKSATGWLVAGLAFLFVGIVPVSIGCFIVYARKNGERKLVQRFGEYCAVIGRRERVPIKELRTISGPGTSVSDVRKQLQQMIFKGYFGPEAYIDLSHNELVLTPAAAYEPQPQRQSGSWKDVLFEVFDALRAEKIFQDAAKEEDLSPEPAPAPEPEPAPKSQPQTPPKKTYAEELERILNELYQLNVQIADEEVSRKIDRIGTLTAGIFRVVIEKPEREQDVRKFMNYYLPTTLKLLRSYDLLEDQSYQSQSIQESRKKIEDVLDMLIGAFEKQLDRLFRDDALDIATDIDVLETMMAGDGLTSKGQMPL